MYKLPYHTEKDEVKMLAFMKAHPFAMVIGAGDGYPAASQLPLEIIEENGNLFFFGHMMKKTSHHLAFEKNENVLAIFTSPHAYVSAAWYKDPAVGSTVNYIAVHAKGKIKFTDDAGTYEAVRSITDRHIGKNSPASFNNLSQEYINAMIKAIVGFKIEVVAIDNVFKLSQNRDAEDRQSIIRHLEERNLAGDVYIAGEMRKLRD